MRIAPHIAIIGGGDAALCAAMTAAKAPNVKSGPNAPVWPISANDRKVPQV